MIRFLYYIGKSVKFSSQHVPKLSTAINFRCNIPQFMHTSSALSSREKNDFDFMNESRMQKNKDYLKYSESEEDDSFDDSLEDENDFFSFGDGYDEPHSLFSLDDEDSKNNPARIISPNKLSKLLSKADPFSHSGRTEATSRKDQSNRQKIERKLKTPLVKPQKKKKRQDDDDKIRFRQNKLGTSVQHYLQRFLIFDSNLGPKANYISFSRIDTSPDLRYVVAEWTVITSNGEVPSHISTPLERYFDRNTKRIRAYLTREIRMKYSPNISFRFVRPGNEDNSKHQHKK